jgi:uncharacterized protein
MAAIPLHKNILSQCCTRIRFPWALLAIALGFAGLVYWPGRLASQSSFAVLMSGAVLVALAPFRASLPQAAVVPVQLSERIQVIDIMRGFASFGILLVNMELFHESFQSYIFGLNPPTNLLDQLARWLIAFLGEGKFYSTFAFLFGLGMAIQAERAQAKGVQFVPFYLRRLAVLLGVGLIHAYLIWVGDILILYAVLGSVLLLGFRHCKPKRLLIWSVSFLLMPLLLNGALFGLLEVAKLTPDGQAMVQQTLAEQMRRAADSTAQANQIYAAGTFVQITQQRVQEMNMVYLTWPFMAFNMLAMLVLGLYTGKQRIFAHLPAQLPFIHKVWWWGLIVGVIGNLVYVAFGAMAIRSVPSIPLLIALTGQTFGAPALALFYMSSLVLLWQRSDWQPRLARLAPVGRLAISNYLLQSLICTTLFYGYGLGLYDQVGITAGLLLTVMIYALQISLSRWWLAHFRFGPVEWLWRSLTYGRRQPMR